MKVAIVSPVGNERNSIEDFMQELSDVLANLECDSRWFPVFDSCCEDGTIDIVKSKVSRYPFINIVDIGKAQGISQAYLSGFQAAFDWGAEKIVEIDVGGHPVQLIPDFVSKLDKFPIVYGARSKYISIHRRFLSKWGSLLSHMVLGLLMSDCTSGFEAFTRVVLEELLKKDFIAHGHMFQTELKYYCKNVPFTEIEFVHSGSKSSLKKNEITEAIKTLFKLRNIDPIRYHEVKITTTVDIYKNLSLSISNLLSRSALFYRPRREMIIFLESLMNLSDMKAQKIVLEDTKNKLKSLSPWFYPVVINGIEVQPAEGGKNVGFSGDQLKHRTAYRRKILVDDLCNNYDFTGKSVLDIGSNCGYWGAEYAKKGASSYIGVEGRKKYCEQGELYWEFNNFLPTSHYQFMCGDILKEDIWNKLGSMEPFDFCLCAGMMYHIFEHEKLLKRILNVTKEALLVDTRVVTRRKKETGRKDISGSFAALTPSSLIKIPLLHEITDVLEQYGYRNVLLKTDDPFPSDLIGKEKDNYEKGNRVAILGIKNG